MSDGPPRGRLTSGEGRLGAGARAILLIAAAVIVLAAMKLSSPVLVPILVAGCIAAAMMPIVNILRRRGMGTAPAVGLTTVAVLITVLAFGVVLALAMSDVTLALPRLESVVIQARDGAVQWLEQHRLRVVATPLRGFDPGELGTDLVADALMAVPGVLSALGVVLFVAIFILLEGANFDGKLRRALSWDAGRLWDVQHTVGEVQRYLLFKGGLGVLGGLLCGVWSAMMGQQTPVFWGVVVFLLSFIPGFGSVGSTAAATLAAIAELGMAKGAVVLLGYVMIHNLIGNLLEPKVLGRAMGLSPLVVMVSIVIWGWVLGPVGALLSAPLTMIVKIVLAHTEDLRFMAVLLGPGSAADEQDYVEEHQRVRRTRSFPGTPSVVP